ncbi:MAG: hypothetical protein WD059_12400 [Balneolaceae bacterium]
MEKIRLFLLISFTFLAASCVTPEAIIDYSATSVPEESGLNFVQYTEDQDNVAGPHIKEFQGKIDWYAPPLISISPDGNSLAYNGLKDNRHNIFVKSTIGGRSVVQRTFRNNVLDMSFSPDGEKIVFTDASSQGQDIKMINTNSGSSIQQITSGNYQDVGPRFSPNGQKIYFTRATRRSNNQGQEFQSFIIWGFDLESSLFTQYTEGFTPNITSDGKELIITRNNRTTGFGEIWKVNIDSGQETLILSDSERGFSSPQISPAGDDIIIVGSTEATGTRPVNLDIYSVKMDGTGLTQHTFHPGQDVSPIWSPNGEHLFILSQRGSEEGSFNVWRMNMQ